MRNVVGVCTYIHMSARAWCSGVLPTYRCSFPPACALCLATRIARGCCGLPQFSRTRPAPNFTPSMTAVGRECGKWEYSIFTSSNNLKYVRASLIIYLIINFLFCCKCMWFMVVRQLNNRVEASSYVVMFVWRQCVSLEGKLLHPKCRISVNAPAAYRMAFPWDLGNSIMRLCRCQDNWKSNAMPRTQLIWN